MSVERTVSERLVDYCMGINYSSLSPEAITEAKRMALDVFGVAIVGSQASWSKMVQELVFEMAGPEESTVIGGGRKVLCGNAVLANGIALRHPEYCGHLQTKDTLMAIHCEENVPTALAVCEKQSLGGKELLTSIVLAAELQGMLGMVADHEHECGIRHTTPSIFTVPLITGRLLHLTREQMINAVAISGSFVLMTHECHSGPHVTPVRDLAFGMGASHGIRSTLLAQKGFTGPPGVFEGEWGFLKVLGTEGIRARGRIEKMFEKRPAFLISNYGYKVKVGDGTVQSPGDGILAIRREHKVNYKDVKAIRLYLTGFADTYSEPRRRPINKSDADHSGFYEVARALIDGDLQYPEQYTNEKIFDSEVNELMDKVEVYVDPKMAAEQRRLGPPAGLSLVEVHMNDGKVYSKKTTYVKGYGPLKTQEVVENHFTHLASKYLKPRVVTKLRDAILNLEDVQDVGKMMDLVRIF